MLTFGGSGPPAEETSLDLPPRVGAPNIFVFFLCYFFFVFFFYFLFSLSFTNYHAKIISAFFYQCMRRLGGRRHLNLYLSGVPVLRFGLYPSGTDNNSHSGI